MLLIVTHRYSVTCWILLEASTSHLFDGFVQAPSDRMQQAQEAGCAAK